MRGDARLFRRIRPPTTLHDQPSLTQELSQLSPSFLSLLLFLLTPLPSHKELITFLQKKNSKKNYWSCSGPVPTPPLFRFRSITQPSLLSPPSYQQHLSSNSPRPSVKRIFRSTLTIFGRLFHGG